MTVYNFDGAFANINSAIEGIGRKNEIAFQRRGRQEAGAMLLGDAPMCRAVTKPSSGAPPFVVSRAA